MTGSLFLPFMLLLISTVPLFLFLYALLLILFAENALLILVIENVILMNDLICVDFTRGVS